MNHWIFIVKKIKIDQMTFSAEEVLETRWQNKFWGLGEKTPNRRNLKVGDLIIFYMGSPQMLFMGTAQITKNFISPESQDAAFKITENLKTRFELKIRNQSVSQPPFGVQLNNIIKWDQPKLAKDLVPYLRFIENKEYWGAYFQGGVRYIPEEDYQKIVGETKPRISEIISTPEEDNGNMVFSLEAHLKDFILKNWGQIWGSEIKLYESEEQNGQQFTAGTWSIDFLAVDVRTNDFVVIELKKGKTSDQVVGQVLRYIGWVKKNLVEESQNVRGIIITKEYDEALKYAIQTLENVEVRTYQVNFQLTKSEKII